MRINESNILFVINEAIELKRMSYLVEGISVLDRVREEEHIYE